MFSRGIAVIAVTRSGVETALKIKIALNALQMRCTVYAPKKHELEGTVAIDKPLDEFIKGTYPKVDAIVAVMATGIIIRAVAPYLQSKLVDPAVIAVDAAGRFVVSLLSGHYGGANELVRVIAESIGATPVITTASDALGKQSVDELARALHWEIVNPESLVAINSALVNGKRMVLVSLSDVKIPKKMISGYTVEFAENAEQALEIVDNYDAGAVVTQEPLALGEFKKPVTVLKPKKIIVGLGARKDIKEDQILSAIDTALKQLNLPVERVDGLASANIKKEERGMICAAAKLKLNIDFISIEELRGFKHDDLSPDSKMVEGKIGVGGVCERAALITAGKNAHLILKKQKLNGVTVAVAEGE